METLKVGTKSNPNSVAGALANVIREKGTVEIHLLRLPVDLLLLVGKILYVFQRLQISILTVMSVQQLNLS